ncbi:D-Ala-D-Ala carboxypeptidase family metallohydrolase [Fulvivirga ulvae]|uniref:D-Ala-D-Ala carboxypeptidase family metallohydrolase n=1 Tax=Fulvivirga ulvae TaxID=2904245 RepID=UPI001F3E5FFD|nr:D-Ala-D-Ala carboxypeptidase family metallohydrolase [Fulvivirga ulvae]UII35062.1 D-Ala-D-Ala carboxypeptidase family metallohydrolase [Fulvivirga ulvae]
MWNTSSFATESKAKIDESNYTKEEKAFFEHYKNTADAYLKSWYKQQGSPKQQLTADMYVKAAKRVFKKYGHLSYVVPVELALIQGRLESKLGMTGASAYTNPYNVGEYDGGARSWVKDITTAEMGIFAYMDLMAHDYLSDKTADQLLEKQGESFVNEENSRYASAPRYEMEIKAMMGQVMLVADGKRTKKPVGKGKNNATKDGEFVRTLLKSAGYTDKDLGTAILKFQSEVMYPPLTAKQKRYVTKMNSNDLKSHNDKEATGKDGIASTKANTLGLLYYMYKKTSAKTEKASADSWDITKDNLWQAYSDFKNDKINMIAFAKACAPHGGTHGHDINLIVDKLGFTTRDNFAIALMNHTSDSLLAQFDSELLQNLHDNLGTYWLTNATKSKMYEEARERINKLLGGKTDEGATAKKESEVKKSGKSAREIISYDKIPENYRKQFAISESVGPKKWGKNKKADVEIVQQLLKLNGYELSIDGGIGVLTLNCIFHFQKIEGLTGDTKIGTSGDTLKRLVEKAYFNGAYDEKEGEIDKAKATELNAARKGKISDIPASLVANVTDGHLIGIDNSDYLLPKPLHADAKRLKTALETIKKDVGDFTISCGYRSPEHNVGIGSTASKSQHVFGIAADIHSPAGYTPKTLKSAIEKLISNGDIPEGGIGTYYWGCHYDIRGTKARWGS